MNKPFYSLMLCFFLFVPPISGHAELTFGPGPEEPGNALDAIVAVVNDDVITRRELDVATAVIERQLRQRKVSIPPRSVLENQVLERLILAQLQVRAAERNGITVDDATLNAAIETLAQRNNMNLTQMRQTVEKDGISFARFRDDVRREIMGARLRQKLVDSQLQVSEQDVESLRAQLVGQNGFGSGEEGVGGGSDSGGARQYHIAQILVALPEGATPQQIDAVRRKADDVVAQLRKGADFQQLAVGVSAGRQALEGGDLGWRTADQLPTLFAGVVPKLRPGQFSELIRSPSGFHIVKLLEVKGGGATPVHSRAPTAEKQGLVTETHARHILLKTSPQLSDDEARQRLEQLRQRVRSGEDFATLAKDNSDDKVSGARGGDLGWVTPGMLVPQFEQEMKSLQPNQISAPFKTQFGWHIVQVLERRQGRASPEMDRTRAREALLRRRSDEEWELLLRRLRDEAYVEVRLQSAASIPAAAVSTPSTSPQ
ncbi:MAG TPA: peptidylprolyl isomerase [Candidatus Competibacter sp.]|nr:peptidylprolyl isomerase [Candidatus Competibacter sp.]